MNSLRSISPYVQAVLSDSNKRFLYDVGVYDSEDDDADVILLLPCSVSVSFREGNSVADGVFCAL